MEEKNERGFSPGRWRGRWVSWGPGWSRTPAPGRGCRPPAHISRLTLHLRSTFISFSA